MKHIRLFILLSILVFSTSLFSAIIPPRPSLLASATQKIGLTDISIVYSRPNAKEREIFGGLVPYGEVWRTGANRTTTIELETDVILGGHKLSKGKYALFTIPGEETWTVIINSNPDQFGAFTYDSALDVFRFEVPSQKLPAHIESFEIHFTNTHDNQAEITIAWADTFISFEVSVTDETNHEQMMASIQRDVIDANDPDWRDLGEAARYYVKLDYDLESALTWLETCNQKNPDAWWMIGEKVEVLKKLNRKDEAVAAANKMLSHCESIKHEGGIGWAKEQLAGFANS